MLENKWFEKRRQKIEIPKLFRPSFEEVQTRNGFRWRAPFPMVGLALQIVPIPKLLSITYA
jgi:hypothetical protein